MHIKTECNYSKYQSHISYHNYYNPHHSAACNVNHQDMPITILNNTIKYQSIVQIRVNQSN